MVLRNVSFPVRCQKEVSCRKIIFLSISPGNTLPNGFSGETLYCSVLGPESGLQDILEATREISADVSHGKMRF